MTTIHLLLGIAVVAVNLAAGLFGAWAWWRGSPQPAFWIVLRAGQALLGVQVVLGFVLLAGGREPAELHLLYGALPVAVSFVGEQLRLAAADQVLGRRGMESAQDMHALDEDERLDVVLDVVRRETGVMAVSALVVALLALRAADVSGGWVL